MTRSARRSSRRRSSRLAAAWPRRTTSSPPRSSRWAGAARAVPSRGRSPRERAPGWLRGTASLTDPTIPAPLRTTFSTFGGDASLGAAGRLSPRSSRVGVWLVGDAGYGWAPSQHLALAPALPASDRDKAGVTTLADLAPRGVFFRLALALAF